jgi:hypothetical protein
VEDDDKGESWPGTGRTTPQPPGAASSPVMATSPRSNEAWWFEKFILSGKILAKN